MLLLGLARRWPVAGIFILALSVRVAWVATLGEQLHWPDEREFVDIARHLAAGDGYVSTSYRANPVLPFYLGATFSIFGESYLAARLGQCLFGALTCVLIYRIAALVAGRAVGIVSALLLALYLPHVYLSGVFYVECLFILLVGLSIYLSVRIAQGDCRIGVALLCGISCGTTILTRPIFALYVPLIGIPWLYCAGSHWRKRVPLYAGALLVTVVTVLPWTVRNYFFFGRLLPVTSGFYTTLWQGNNPLARGDADDRLLFPGNRYWAERISQLDAEERRLVEKRYGEFDSLFKDLRREGSDQYLATDVAFKSIALDYIREHPARTAWLFLRRLQTLFSAFTPTHTVNSFTSRWNQLLAAVAFYPMLALALVGTRTGMREQRSLWVIYLFIGSMCAAYASLTACTRFRLPLDPYLIAFSGMALVHLWQVWLSPARRRFAPLPERTSQLEPALCAAESRADVPAAPTGASVTVSSPGSLRA